MKKSIVNFSRVILSLILCVAVSRGNTQNGSGNYLSVPGPSNQDSSQFATLYIMRPDNEIASKYWLGIYFNDTLMVRVDNNFTYIIKNVHPGNTRIWSKNEVVSSLDLVFKAREIYYIKMDMEPGGKIGNPKLVLLNEQEGKETVAKISNPALVVYDPDPFMNSKYVWPSAPRTGYEHMIFTPPLSTRHYFISSLEGFKFSFYNRSVSPTFTELDGVYGGKMKFSDKEEFDKFAQKQINNLQKGFKRSETLKELVKDTLSCGADYIYSVYFVTEDSKASLPGVENIPLLELRQYSTLLYKKDPNTGKGDYYSVYFSERGIPAEIHSREEIKSKIQTLLSSCQFPEGDNK